MKIKYNSILKRTSHLWKQFENGTVLVKHLKTMDQYYLNPVLAKLWLEIDGKRSVKDILKTIKKKNLQLSKNNELQLLNFLNDLYQKKLVDIPKTM